MAAPATSNPADALLGRVAVAAKMITMEQLAQATREQSRPGNTKNLGQVLVALGFIDEATLAKAVELQRGVIARAKEKRAEAPAPAASEVGAESDARAAEALARQARPAAPAPAAPRPRDQARRAAGRAAGRAADGGEGAARRRSATPGGCRPRSRSTAASTRCSSTPPVRARATSTCTAARTCACACAARCVEVPDAKLAPPLAEKLILSGAVRRGARAARGARRARLLLHGAGPRALPRERLPPAARARRDLPAASRRSRRRSSDLGLPTRSRSSPTSTRAWCCHRPVGVRQVVDAGGAREPDQRGARASTSSRSRTRSSTCTRRSAAS